MNHFTFETRDQYRVCFLVNKIQMKDISNEYLKLLDIPKEEVLILDLYKDPKRKKTTASDMKEYLQEVEETLAQFKVEYVVICNGDYFKTFSSQTKADVWIGYIKSVNQYKVLYCPDYKAIFYDPDKVRVKIYRALNALNQSIKGIYEDPGTLQFTEHHPCLSSDIEKALTELSKEPELTCDIETFSLRPHLAGIASIGFAKNIQEGTSFMVDQSSEDRNEHVRMLLKAFFKSYQGKLIFHNIAFDASVLIYQLYMNDITDTEGLLEGINDLLKNFEDTKLIAYLATNSCAGNELGLKALAHEFAGNWAQEEIGDISKIPQEELLRYNVIDCLATWYVYNKYKPIMIDDQQEEIYKNLFIPATRDIVQMQLTGFPISMNRVLEVEKILQKDMDDALSKVVTSSLVHNFLDILKQEWVEKRNSELKVKRVTLADAVEVEFNPRSHPQLQRLLYEVMNLPEINKTDSGLPATDGDTLKALLNHTDNEEYKQILQGLIDFAAVDKILGTFIPAFKDAVFSSRLNWHFLIGNFNLGGTVSGRLSSNRPNLQQLPATGSKYAKIIKSCFIALKGWLLCGLDFNALEAHIDALVTKDPAKLDVYIKDYDSHSYNAYHYWPNKHPEVELLTEEYTGKCFKCIINGQKHLLKGSDLINYDQRTATVETLFNSLSFKE